MAFEDIVSKNPGLNVKKITDESFNKFGRILTGYDFSELIEYMEGVSIPEQGNIYVAKDEKMMETKAAKLLSNDYYGEQAIEIGYCNGRNSRMNALEYHKCPEIDIAATDLLLLLGDIRDINNNQYESEKLEAFYVPSGTACELYSTTLHFSPCRVKEEGFKTIIILTEGTNTPLTGPHTINNKEDALLFLKNKWLIGHEESIQVQEKNGYKGICGANIEINF